MATALEKRPPPVLVVAVAVAPAAVVCPTEEAALAPERV